MNEQNLRPVRTTEEAKAKGAIGGKKSGEQAPQEVHEGCGEAALISTGSATPKSSL